MRFPTNMKRHVIWRLLGISLLLGGSALGQDADPWADYEKVDAILVGPEDDEGPRVKIRISFIDPLPVTGEGRGRSAAEGAEDIILRSTGAGDHAFLVTSEGDLFIDNLFAGRFREDDILIYGKNRLWANGKPQELRKPTKEQERLVFSRPETEAIQANPALGVALREEADGSRRIMNEPWKVWVKPAGGWGGGSGDDLLNDGMTMLRFEGDILYLHGISFGRIEKGDEIRVIDGVVSINGKIRQPHLAMNKQAAEKDGVEQPAAAPEPKPEGGDEAKPESEGRPR